MIKCHNIMSYFHSNIREDMTAWYKYNGIFVEVAYDHVS
jgi:hypothetical protein